MATAPLPTEYIWECVLAMPVALDLAYVGYSPIWPDAPAYRLVTDRQGVFTHGEAWFRIHSPYLRFKGERPLPKLFVPALDHRTIPLVQELNESAAGAAPTSPQLVEFSLLDWRVTNREDRLGHARYYLTTTVPPGHDLLLLPPTYQMIALVERPDAERVRTARVARTASPVDA